MEPLRPRCRPSTRGGNPPARRPAAAGAAGGGGPPWRAAVIRDRRSARRRPAAAPSRPARPSGCHTRHVPDAEAWPSASRPCSRTPSSSSTPSGDAPGPGTSPGWPGKTSERSAAQGSSSGGWIPGAASQTVPPAIFVSSPLHRQSSSVTAVTLGPAASRAATGTGCRPAPPGRGPGRRRCRGR